MTHRVPLTGEELAKKIEEIKPLASVFDLLTVQAVITDENANILYMNHATEEKTGFSRVESIGKTPGDLWGGIESDEFFETMWKTIKVDKQSFVTSIHNRTKDGTDLYHQLSITPILDTKEAVKYFVAIEVDITKQIEAEQLLRNQVNTLLTVEVDREKKMKDLKDKLEAISGTNQRQ